MFLKALPRTFTFALLLISSLGHSQVSRKKPPVDSADFYQGEINKLFRQQWDSLRKSGEYQSLVAKRNQAIRRRNDYSGMRLFTEIAHSDYRVFNLALQQNGFPALNPVALRFGFGTSAKRGNAMYDFSVGVIGLNNSTKKGNEKITTAFSNALQLDFGIDILNEEKVSFYPFGGLSWRFSDITYRKRGQSNPNYTFLSNMVSDENSIRLSSSRLGYQYGIEFDYAFGYNRERTYKTIAFIKAGVNRSFKHDTYEANGLPDYKPEIRQGDWLISVGFKFASKR